MMNATATVRRLVVVLLAPLLLAACAAAGPQPAHWGVEECTHCRMVIGDERFAGQIVDRRGNTYKFDALECMAAYLNDERIVSADVHSIWVASGRDGWIRVDDAGFLYSEQLRSPMGGGYSAHAGVDAARRVQQEIGGELLSWEQLVARAAAQGPADHSEHGHHTPGRGGQAHPAGGH